MPGRGEMRLDGKGGIGQRKRERGVFPHQRQFGLLGQRHRMVRVGLCGGLQQRRRLGDAAAGKFGAGRLHQLVGFGLIEHRDGPGA